MATKNTAQDNAKSSTLLFIKGARVLTYFVHGFALTAAGFLSTSFVLLIFSANVGTPFVNFVYTTSSFFLSPFREIFLVRSISETGYFSPSILFAIIMYLLFALGLHTLINYLTSKMVESQAKIDAQEAELKK